MNLTRRPLDRRLPDPGVPFVVYGVWAESPEGRIFATDGTRFEYVRMSVANLPGGPLAEYAVGGSLAAQLAQVWAEELPIVLSLKLAKREDGNGEWRFQYLGSDPAGAFPIPADLQPTPPRPQSPEELGAAAETMLRESVGLGPDDPLPQPQGPLPPAEQPSEPERYDPTPHMDLDTAEPAPPLPEPAAPGPLPPADAQTSPVPEIPTPARPLGAFGDNSIPFAH